MITSNPYTEEGIAHMMRCNNRLKIQLEGQEKLTKLYERKVLDLAIELEQLKRKKILGIF